MLQEFRVDNYKSFINVTFRPQDMNLLIGLNNSGKTTLCQAMRFVAATASISLDQCADNLAGGRVGITNHFFDKPTTDFFIRATIPHQDEKLTFEYELTILPPKNYGVGATLTVEKEKLTVTGGKFENTILLENTQDKVRLLHENDYLKGDTNYIETTAPRDVTMLNRLYELETNTRANRFKRYLNIVWYYDFSIASLKGSSHKPNEFFLNIDGSNLSSVIYRLKTSNERDYRKLLKYIQIIEPKIDVINFQVASENNVFMYFEDAEGHSLPAWNASNGTLRFLAMIYALFVQPQLLNITPIADMTPLLMIEEPENGIYVGFLKDLLEISKLSPKRPQVIFTSHSPYFIDLFDEHIEGIFVLNRGKQHSTITQPDPEKVKLHLENYPLGEQHFREMLG